MFQGLSSINGELTDKTAIDDRGLAFGDGLFETLLVYPRISRQPYFLQRHLIRLQQGCVTLGIHLDIALLEKEIAQLLNQLSSLNEIPEQLRLKIIVTRGSSSGGYKIPKGLTANRILVLSSLLGNFEKLAQEGVRLRSCHWTLPSQPQLAGIKHLTRLAQVMARREWDDARIFEGVLSDKCGNLIEGTCSNLFLVDEKGIKTPELSECGVKGIMRQLVIEKLSKAINVPVRVDAFTNMDDAGEVFITNSIIGVLPVTAFDTKTFSIGKITRSLQLALQNLRELHHEI